MAEVEYVPLETKYKVLEDLAREVVRELERATRKHGPMRSAHEGHAVIREEFDELWDEVKTQNASIPAMREEAIQVAAMAMRFVLDVCDKDHGG